MRLIRAGDGGRDPELVMIVDGAAGGWRKEDGGRLTAEWTETGTDEDLDNRTDENRILQ